MDLLLVLLAGGVTFYIIYILSDPRTEEEEILQDRLKRISKAAHVPEEQAKATQSIFDALITNYFEPLIQSMNKKKQEDAKKKRDIRQLLMEAGKPFSDDDILRFRATQIFGALVALVIGLILGVVVFNQQIMMALVAVILITAFGMYMPIFSLRFEVKKRCTEIQYNLPDCLDLLVVCVEAGLGLDAALTRVSQEQMRTSPIIARELGRVSKDIMAGVPRQDAFRNLAQRNNVPDLKSFVALLIQTDKLGTSIAQSLRVYADTVRTKRRQKAEKLAAEASVKMVIPLVLFILPSMFVVLLGPAILNLVEQFSGGALK